MATPSSALVLSYNICYQAMCHDPNGTAAALGKSCDWYDKSQNLTICAVNMAQMIDQTPAAVGAVNFDFVGLQEASNWDALQTKAPNTLGKMKAISSKAKGTAHSKGAKMTSFYDGNKYTLNESYCSEFSSSGLARPFHILLLTEISTKKEIIFINVHTPHGGDLNTHTNVPYKLFDAVEYDLSAAAQNMKLFNPKIQYHIIMTGDFNETGWDWHAKDLKPKKWSPLKSTGLTIEVEILNFVLSCSKDNGCWQSADAGRGGDYIFNSGTAAKIQVPGTYKFAPKNACGDDTIMKSYWQSDHLPVMAVLT